MKKICSILIFIFTVLILLSSYLYSKSPTLFVVTRSTKKFRLSSRDNPTVGLFSTNDKGKTWQHYGWKYTKCFSVSIAHLKSQKIFYLSCGNGVLKSDDRGKSWIITTGWNITECLKTAIDPKNPNIVYAATAYGIFKTTDGGKSWVEKNQGLNSTFTPTVVIDQKDHNLLFCATEAGIHRSKDSGNHWEPIGLLGLGIRTLSQHPKKPDLLAVGTEDDGVFISEDYGKTWQQKINGLTNKTVYAFAFAPQDPNIIYAGTFRGGIFKSTDRGESWQAVNNGLRILDIHALLVDPRDKNTVYVGTLNDGLWISEDGGDNWRFIGLETSQVWDMIIE
ncbi:MAG: hypothetical protein JSW07_15365 [bacterium]|nr:MAG: hypothetical protein JSW07_15365 [bacterium]